MKALKEIWKAKFVILVCTMLGVFAVSAGLSLIPSDLIYEPSIFELIFTYSGITILVSFGLAAIYFPWHFMFEKKKKHIC